MTSDYSVEEHKHRFAVWAASTAARVPRFRISVADGMKFLEELGLRHVVDNPSALPGPSPKDIDKAHKAWREKLVDIAAKSYPQCSQGNAAKLTNMYLKSLFVCGGFHEHPNVAALHPPIDRLLLDKLARKNVGGHQDFWRAMHRKGWTSFDSDEYQSVISKIRDVMRDRPLWEIEQHWPGHQ